MKKIKSYRSNTLRDILDAINNYNEEQEEKGEKNFITKDDIVSINKIGEELVLIYFN